jgi:uncharacterized repeat protein (TIGR01451 family)
MFAIVLSLLAPAAASAAPDFAMTTITADPAAPLEGDVVTFTVVIRNSGDRDSPYSQVQITLPHEGMSVDFSGFDGAVYDRDARTISGSLPIAAGGEARVSFRILTLRDSGGNVLSPMVKVSNLFLGATDRIIHADVDIQTRVSTSGIPIGGIRIAPAGLALIVVLALYPLLYVMIGRRVGHGPVMALVIAIGFWTIFAGLARRDWASLQTWRETTCTIRDSRLRGETSASRPPGTTTTAAQRPTTTQTTTYQNVLALEYAVGGKAMVSSGFDTGSRLSIGGLGGALNEFSRWPIGQTVPCWFDPEHPDDVVVIRGFGGAYFFALFPLPLFVYAVRAITRPRQYT